MARLNPLLRGWANYFSRTNAREHFGRVDGHVVQRLWAWWDRKHDGHWRAPSGVFASLLAQAGLYRTRRAVVYAR